MVETKPIINEVLESSPAFNAGLLPNDEILAINNKYIDDFNDVIMAVSVSNNQEMLFSIRRKAEIFDVKIKPQISIKKDFAGEEVKLPMIGIIAKESTQAEVSFIQSFKHATIETYSISASILRTMGQLVTGQRSIKELGGPIKIAKYSGKTFKSESKIMVLWFLALISINLGVINLLPIPVLDGGHLIYYLIEALRGRALSQKIQKIGYQIGFSLIITLMIFTTINDIFSIMPF